MNVKIIQNGPILLDTSELISITAGDATERKPGPLYLCRCGQSANKPYCDSTHRKVKFEGKPAELICP